MGFENLGLSPKVLEAVEASGYTQPTQIQAEAIPHVLQRRDVLGIAQTGTGKTASFTLPMITMLEKGRARARMPRTLILEPTRELAAQVADNFEKYGAKHKLSMALLIGGVSFEEQDRKLNRGVDVLIATPGRLLDHFERGKLLMTGVEIFVIDEADRMLDMGFIPDIERISKMVPFTRQTLFFSATMPPEIDKLADKFLQNPVRLEVARASSTAATITQRIVATHGKDFAKRESLRKLIDGAGELKNGIIFCNRKRDVHTVYKSLTKHGYSVGSLHGDMDQRARMETLSGFKNNDITLLVASDVAARGLDIPDVSHVFNYDIPTSPEDYVHRIGRTGRAGREGAAFTLVSRNDQKYLDALEKLIEKQLEWHDGDLSSLDDGGEEEAPKRGRGRKKPETTASDDSEKPSRTRSRGGRGRKRGEEGEVEAVADTKLEAGGSPAPEADSPSANEEAPKGRGRGRNNRDGGRDNDRNRDQSNSEKSGDEERSSGRGRAGRGRNRQDDLGPSVIGFGDHLPAFVTRGFEFNDDNEPATDDATGDDQDLAQAS
ncbi:MAG: DEAD/DEAH box helicase [Pseudomonadota bacterium]